MTSLSLRSSRLALGLSVMLAVCLVSGGRSLVSAALGNRGSVALVQILFDPLSPSRSFSGVVVEYERAISVDPRNLTAHAGLARLLITEADWSAADTILWAAESIDHDDPNVNWLLGRALLERGEVSEAIAHWGEARAVVPLSQLGTELLNQGRWAEASRAFRLVLAEDEDNAAALHGVGKVLLITSGNLGHAMPWFDRAMSADPDYVWPYLTIGDWHRYTQRYDAAASWYTRARELAPHSELPLVSMGSLALERHDLREAQRYYGQARQMNPTNPWPYAGLATVLHRQGELGLAEQSTLKAIQLRDDVKDFHELLGSIYRDWGRYSEAISEYKIALSLDPEDAQLQAAIEGLESRISE